MSQTEADLRASGSPGADPAPSGAGPRRAASVAERLRPLIYHFFGGPPPVRFIFWDQSTTDAVDDAGTVEILGPDALSRFLWSPDELGLARAFIAGDVEFEGDIFALLHRLDDALKVAKTTPPLFATGLRAALRTGALTRPPRPPEEEVRLLGRRHSKRRDAAAISHHYDVGNEFYRLVLGPTMTYSCARFDAPDASLEAAQASKHELICRKLGLDERPGLRLLDVGCGWGEMSLHAARKFRAKVVGITLSPAQAEGARARARAEGLEDLVEIRLQDYRDVAGEQFDAISSIGMFEHVGEREMGRYFTNLAALLSPRGRFLNHAISKPNGSTMHGRHFINRYVFPDGELIDVARVAAAMEHAGLEVRDVESLREHYVRTLRAWVKNLDRGWGEAVRLVGVQRARVWKLYMAASANAFELGRIAVHQVLGVRPGDHGDSGMPATRNGWAWEGENTR